MSAAQLERLQEHLLAQGDWFSRASWPWPPQRNGKRRSRWSSVLIIGQRLSRDQSREINRLSAGRGFGEAQGVRVSSTCSRSPRDRAAGSATSN